MLTKQKTPLLNAFSQSQANKKKNFYSYKFKRINW
jgi:hypothetical protein